MLKETEIDDDFFILRDEQIIAALTILLNCPKVVYHTLDSLFIAATHYLPPLKIFWQHEFGTKNCKHLAETYPSIFNFEQIYLECIADNDTMFNTFLAAYPKTVQVSLATFIQTVLASAEK